MKQGILSDGCSPNDYLNFAVSSSHGHRQIVRVRDAIEYPNLELMVRGEGVHTPSFLISRAAWRRRSRYTGALGPEVERPLGSLRRRESLLSPFASSPSWTCPRLMRESLLSPFAPSPSRTCPRLMRYHRGPVFQSLPVTSPPIHPIIPSHPIPSRPVPSCPVPSHPIP